MEQKTSLTLETSYGKASMLVCVDGLCGSKPTGAILNPYFAEETPFYGVDELIFELDRLCDILDYPQASFERRTIFPRKLKTACIRTEDAMPEILDRSRFPSRKGKLASYMITVMYRQHGSMQGEIALRTGAAPRKCCFRSALELMHLLWELIPISTTTK